MRAPLSRNLEKVGTIVRVQVHMKQWFSTTAPSNIFQFYGQLQNQRGLSNKQRNEIPDFI